MPWVFIFSSNFMEEIVVMSVGLKKYFKLA